MTSIIRLLIKYKSFIMYAVFGVLTTIVNLLIYYLCYRIIDVPNVPSTVIAWIVAVSFAFITNKTWVFNSRLFTKEVLRYEILTFFSARGLTGLMDVAIMYVTVDRLHWNSMIWKLVSNILVIISNYIASRYIVFQQSKDRKEKHG